MGNLRLIEQVAVANPVLPLNLEHGAGNSSRISQLKAVVRRARVLSDELVFLDVVGFLADRLLSQCEDVATLQRSALVKVPTLKFSLRVEVIADQAAAMGFQPGRRNRITSFTIKRM